MILPDFILQSRQNQTWSESGIDSLKGCLDKEHFKSYPYQITYNYNSRGFRDTEWPDNITELRDSIWCIGDSFTVGIGSPLTHTWVNLLQGKLNQRCINVSMDGASNNWIARKAIQVLKTIKPKIIVIQWSYIQRGESDDYSLTDETRRLRCWSSDINKITEQNYKLIAEVETYKHKCSVIHSSIPNITQVNHNHIVDIWDHIKGTDWPELPKTLDEFYGLPGFIVNELTNIFKVYKLFQLYYTLLGNIIQTSEIITQDLARDGLHYDVLTATKFVAQLENLIVDLRLT